MAVRNRTKREIRAQIETWRLQDWLARGCRCAWCGKPIAAEEVTADHRVPRMKGGRHTARNIVASCEPCNVAKGSRWPKQFERMLAGNGPVPTAVLVRRIARRIVERTDLAVRRIEGLVG